MSNEKEPRPWSEVERTHSEIPEDIQDMMITSWKKTGQNGSDVGVIARMYNQEWTKTWRLLRLVLPARERKGRNDRARAKRMAQKAAEIK
jgi:hypothetical protein